MPATPVRDTRNKGITKAAVAAAAAEVLQEKGIARLSMREVALRLGASPMALYNHVPDKEGLLELLATHLRAQVLLDDRLPPRDQLVSLLVQLRDLGAQHPRLLEDPLALVGSSAEALEVPLRILRLLAAMGLDPAQARTAYNALSFVVTGAASVQRSVAQYGATTLRQRERTLLAMAPGRDQELVRAVVALPRTTLDEQFVAAIDLVVRSASN